MEGITAVDFLREYLYNNEKTQILFEEGKVRKSSFLKKLSPDYVLHRDDRIRIFDIKDEDFNVNVAEIVYEDEEFIVFNTPQNMESITKVENGTNLHLFAVDHMKRLGEYDVDTLRVPYVCNVLPKKFGGLSIVAKDQYLFEELIRAFRERRIKRLFRMIVTGEPKEEDLLYGYIQYRNLGNRASMNENMNRKARPAALRYRLLETKGELSLLEVEPLSFLKDQIASQLAGAGLPILGDETFGSREMNRRYSVEVPAIWGSKLVFETGTNNYLDYLNGREIEVVPYHMSGIGYFIERKEMVRERRVEALNPKQLKNASRIVWNSFNKSLIKEFDREFISDFRNANRAVTLAKEMETGTVFFGCYTDSGIAGVISVNGNGEIRRLYVLRSQQNKGVGELLLRYAEDWCFEHHIEHTRVFAPGTSYLYFKKKGYVESDEMADRPQMTVLTRTNLQ